MDFALQLWGGGFYLLAKHNRNGWLLFMLMNGSMAVLMFIQHKPILTAQQLVSLCFVAYGYLMAMKTPGPRRIETQT